MTPGQDRGSKSQGPHGHGRRSAILTLAIVLCGVGMIRLEPGHAWGLTGVWGVATAQAQQRVVVRDFAGPGSPRVRSAVLQVLSEHSAQLSPVGNRELEGTASQHGADLGSPRGRVQAAEALALNAIIEGQVQRRGRRWQASIVVYEGATGTVLAQAEFQGRNPRQLSQSVARGLWQELGAALQDAAAPAPEEPEPEPTPVLAPTPAPAAKPPPPTQAPPETAADTSQRPSPVEVRLGIGSYARFLTYNDNATLHLAGYSLPRSFAVQGEVHLYPLAFAMAGPLAHIGLDLRAFQPIGLGSKTSDGTELTTSSQGFLLGTRLRLPLGEHEAAAVVGFGRHRFAISNAGEVRANVPAVTYRYIHLGAEGRIETGSPLSFGLRAAYLALLGVGAMGERPWWPHASGGGIETELSLMYALSSSLDLRLAGMFRHYFFGFNPEIREPPSQSDAMIGGALDQYLLLTAGVAWRFEN